MRFASGVLPRRGWPVDSGDSLLPGMADQGVEPCRFGVQHGAAERRQAVIAAPLVVGAGRWPAARVGDEPILEEPRERGVEGAGAKAQGAARALGDLEDDSVAVALGVDERQQDVKLLRRQRQMGSYVVH